jgi:hypothetical protein
MGYVLCGIEHVVKHDASASHVDVNGQRLRLGLGLQNLALICSVGMVVSPGKLPHEGITAVVVKVDSSNVRVVQGARSTRLFALSSAGTIEC